MNTPAQREKSLSSFSRQPGDKAEQLINAYKARSEASRETEMTPDYIHLIEAELKAFQRELRHIESALAARR